MIKVVDEGDVHVTQAELTRLRHDYGKAFTHYCGPVPTFEEYVRSRKKEKPHE